MDLQNLIEQFNTNTGSTKTASAPEPKPSTDALKSALGEVLGGAQEKTAAASGNPVDDLMKMAAELSGIDKEAEVSMARTLGEAFADSAHRRWNELNTKVGEALEQSSLANAIKLAAQQGYTAANYAMGEQKTASLSQEDVLTEIVKMAEAGDADAQGYLQKLAAEEYTAGQEAALQDVHKIAAQEFLKGAAEVQVLVHLAQQQQ